MRSEREGEWRKEVTPSNKDRKNHLVSSDSHWLENDELIIEENTIYEIDLDCYYCLQQAKKKSHL